MYCRMVLYSLKILIVKNVFHVIGYVQLYQSNKNK
jgi:hypothetical protein